MSTCQGQVNGVSDGAHCPNEMAKVVSDAKAAQSTADGNKKTADSNLAAAEKVPVKFNAIPLDQIDATNCAALMNKLKANSNHGAAKSALDAAKTAKTNADAAKTAADKAYTDAVAAQKDAVLKCKCKVVNAANDAYTKCTADAKQQALTWTKSHHLACVENGAVTLNSGGASHTGTCAVPAVPTVAAKKLAYNPSEKECKAVGLEMEQDEQMDEAFEMEENEDDELVEIEDEAPKMPGWHQMEDGSMIQDTDME